MNRKHEWRRRRRSAARLAVEAVGFLGLCGLVSLSAVLTKQATHQRSLTPLAQVTQPATKGCTPAQASVFKAGVLDTGLLPADGEPRGVLGMTITDPMVEAEHAASDETVQIEEAPPDFPLETRWFNGRPVRPARTLWMTVTAYSPDSRSCGEWADGKTASLHSVWTNGMKLAAADTKILPIGSMITVPGYDHDQIVPVLDRGGAIKGYRLDMLYPTHEIAQQWGVRRLKVTVWEYADGKPRSDWRKVRDSK